MYAPGIAVRRGHQVVVFGKGGIEMLGLFAFHAETVNLCVRRALRSLEDIKWVYVGPAFTLAFPEVLMSIVEGFDADLPYFITGEAQMLGLTRRIWFRTPVVY